MPFVDPEPYEEASVSSYELMRPLLWHISLVFCDVRSTYLILLQASHVSMLTSTFHLLMDMVTKIS